MKPSLYCNRALFGFSLSALIFLSAMNLIAEVRMARLFSDNMVLQCDKEIKVWGWADPNENVTVEFAGLTSSTTANTDSGRWQVTLSPVEAGGPYELKAQGSSTVVVKNVLVGEVWVCSGQSNMNWSLKNCINATQEQSEADFPEIRYFSIKQQGAAEPAEDIDSWQAFWTVCSPSAAGDFTGVGYFFARNLYQALDKPIGLIHSSYGGTPAEAWTSKETLESDSILAQVFTEWPDYANSEDWLRELYLGHLDKVEEAKAEGKPEPVFFTAPSVLYNAMIEPMIPYGIRGVIWYQGEANSPRPQQYQTLFPSMITDWRNNWGIGDFPFLFVQLANYQWGGDNWAELRAAQSLALNLPFTGMAVAIDVGESYDIHPRNKQDVGLRLALNARTLVYGERDLVYSGPMFKSMSVEGGKCRLSFSHVGDGLVVKGIGGLRTFEIAGDDNQFVQASAKIEGEAVEVWSEMVENPLTVRYAWADDPQGCNLYNMRGQETWLPAAPFRTNQQPPGNLKTNFDFNHDSNLTTTDVGLFLRLVMGNSSKLEFDLNNDGEVNIVDILSMIMAIRKSTTE
jgi:sialate O-acetylesterase